MVSGFVTSPCDQLRIFSGEAKLMRMASKSAIGFARSNGLERNKISSNSAGFRYRKRLRNSGKRLMTSQTRRFRRHDLGALSDARFFVNFLAQWPVPKRWPLWLICCRAQHGLLFTCLDQFDI